MVAVFVVVHGLGFFEIFFIQQAELSAAHIDRVALVEPATEVDIFAGRRTERKKFCARLGGHRFRADGTSDAAFSRHGRMLEDGWDKKEAPLRGPVSQALEELNPKPKES